MKILLVIMTGIGFTLGVVLGLLLQLPTDSLPAEHSPTDNSRTRRSVRILSELNLPDGPASALSGNSNNAYDVIPPLRHPSNEIKGKDVKSGGSNPVMNVTNADDNGNNRAWQVVAGKIVQRPPQVVKENEGVRQNEFVTGDENNQKLNENRHRDGELAPKLTQGINGFAESINGKLDEPSIALNVKNNYVEGLEPYRSSTGQTQSPEDKMYLKSLVRGIVWTDKLEQSCPRAFKPAETESWRKKAQSADVVKMEEGCGRMQNRQLTFRDASKACARYRLNTDQIQGEIFSYYLAKLLNISNLPPTSLALVNSVDRKWRTVHLDLSLAQWADSKLVVLTQYIEGLEGAHIPRDFREDHRQLHPTLAHLGHKTRTELCELVQWSDLIIFDYLTANLDRVINNMFNRQWNDQIMESPAHNLEKFKNGNLVFLDNESGLFHGYRLIDKYENLHRALLDSLCIFRPSTANAIKRLASSGSIGTELRAMLMQHEPLHRHLAKLPQKNVKILQRRLEQVNDQISKCEKMFNS